MTSAAVRCRATFEPRPRMRSGRSVHLRHAANPTFTEVRVQPLERLVAATEPAERGVAVRTNRLPSALDLTLDLGLGHRTAQQLQRLLRLSIREEEPRLEPLFGVGVEPGRRAVRERARSLRP